MSGAGISMVKGDPDIAGVTSLEGQVDVTRDQQADGVWLTKREPEPDRPSLRMFCLPLL